MGYVVWGMEVHTMGYGVRTMGYGVRSMGYGVRTMGYGVRSMGYGVRTMGYGCTYYGVWRYMNGAGLLLDLHIKYVTLYTSVDTFLTCRRL